MAQGGEVFVLDMGQPVRVYDLARNMIELSGLSIRSPESPDGDIEIEIVGLRPGEKLYEELLIGNDPIRTAHPRIMMANEASLPWEQLSDRLGDLSLLLDRQDAVGVRALLTELVPEYVAAALTDWVSSASRVGPPCAADADSVRAKGGFSTHKPTTAVKRPAVS
jgi:FlaA1/EpsC-like NDP-sugar epimerase